jgi:hypothetical protein
MALCCIVGVLLLCHRGPPSLGCESICPHQRTRSTCKECGGAAARSSGSGERASERACVRACVRASVHPSVRPSVRPSVMLRAVLCVCSRTRGRTYTHAGSNAHTQARMHTCVLLHAHFTLIYTCVLVHADTFLYKCMRECVCVRICARELERECERKRESESESERERARARARARQKSFFDNQEGD